MHEIEAATIFLPKFDNATEATRSLYQSFEKDGHMLVASVKSSGSLWLITGIGSKVMCSSKNGKPHNVLIRNPQG